MRLLKLGSRGELSLTTNIDNNIPPYAILSHTWGHDYEEVTFDDLKNGYGKSKVGYAKIQFCGNKARKDGIEHFWVDTCCINKANHAELSEAITSMFRWYRDAVKCYVYLSDVLVGDDNDGQTQRTWESAFRKSRWFTRGWALQELLAPKSVEFFSREEELLGDKETLEQQIHEITDIPITALHGSPLSDFSVEERLRWAEKRETKRVEDKAYCLMGIFSVFIPLIYGEGDNAFIRLQEKIDKRSGSWLPAATYVHWTVTRPTNPLFTGRDDLLHELDGIIRNAVKKPPDQGQCRIVISGMGGQGKSEICLQLAYRLRLLFWAVFWIDVSTTHLAERSFMDIAQKVTIPAQTWEDALLGIANLNHAWLLVLDNADDPNVDYQNYFPAGTLGVVMLTSRNEECQRYATEKYIALDGLADGEARELLFRAAYVPQHQCNIYEEDAKVVASLLQSHPLALIQAGAYVARGHCTLPEYPHVYERQRQRLLTFRPSQGRSHYRDVYATFEVSADVLTASATEVARDALQLLPLLAVCGPSRLPLPLFEAGWKGAKSVPPDMDDNTEDDSVSLLTPWHIAHLPSLLNTAGDVWDSFRLVEAVSLLKAFSLVSTDAHDGFLSVSMHPLIHAWARDRQDNYDRHQNWLQMGCVMAFARTDADLWKKCERQLQPHIEVLTAWEADTIFAHEPPAMVSRALLKCGWELHTMRADAKLFMLMKKIFTRLGLDWVKVQRPWMGVYDLAGRNLIKYGKVKEAVTLLEKVVMVREHSLTEDCPDRLTSQGALAEAYEANGQVKEAVALLERVVTIQQQTLAVNHPDRLASQRALAGAYEANGQVKQAVALLERVIKIEEYTLAEDHPSRLASQHALALAYQANGQVKEAVTLLERVAKIQQQTLAEDHPDRLASQRALAGAYEANGQVKDAVVLLEEVVKIQQQTLAEDHPSRLASRRALAGAYEANGQVKEAVSLLEQVVKIQEQTLAEDHPSRLASQHALALAYQANGQVKEAVSLLEQVVKIQEQTLAEDHPSRLASQHALAMAYQANGQVKEAVSLLERVVKIQEQLLPEEYPDILSSMENLSEVLYVQDRYEQAGELHQRILELGEKTRKKGASQNTLHGRDHTLAREDSESLSDVTDVSSFASTDSVPSLESDFSSPLFINKDKDKAKNAAQHFASLLFEDPILRSLYREGLTKLGFAKFKINHDALLKSYFKDLRQECQTSREKDTVRTLRREEQRNDITSLIQDALDSNQAVKEQAIAVMQKQKPDRQFHLENYLSSLGREDQKESTDLEYRVNEQTPGQEAPDDIPQTGYDEGSIEDDESSDDSDTGDIHPNLDRITGFLTEGESFARFRSNLRYLLQPPRTLEDALKEHNIHIVERFMTKNFKMFAIGEYEWLWELDEAGYSRREIAELLSEEARDSPWIIFTPQDNNTPQLPSDCHVTDCRHVASSLNDRSIRTVPPLRVFSATSLHSDLLRHVEELCGLGGVAPTSRTPENWNGTVRFMEGSSASWISYKMESDDGDSEQLGLRISKALTGFCRAAALAQSVSICCDCFTVLTHATGDSAVSTEGKRILELRKVRLDLAVQLLEAIDAILGADTVADVDFRDCANFAQMILGTLFEEQFPYLGESLHYCSLAAQFLCVGFLSYIHGHAGPVDPFFLETAQMKMVLFGSKDLQVDISNTFAIECELVHLTCLGEMINQPVLAFHTRLETPTSAAAHKFRYDVSALIDDLLDTWGPGYLICSRSQPDKILAIGIGGGYITQRSGMNSKFHWSQNIPQMDTGPAHFLASTQLLIGAAVMVNANCHIDEQRYRSKHCTFLQQLGTHEAFWSIVERQIGLQAGQYASLLYNQTYKLTPARSLKARYFQPGGWLHLSSDLDHTWGLQVSLCTGIARRVRLRDLLAELLPKFIDPTKRELWRRLKAQKVIEAFENGNFGDWLEKIEADLQDYLLVLVRSILEYLEETGVDHKDKNLVIAWPIQDDLQRCLRIPCEQQTRWARILADSAECATFACVTAKCLVTDKIKCGGAGPWANASRMLATAFSCASPLKDDEKYFVKRFDTLFLIRVEKPVLGGVPHLIVRPSMIPSQIRKRIMEMERKKRNQTIRERQSHLDQAEDVIVRAIENV